MNYKALNTDFTEEDLRLSWKEWLWSKCPYQVRNFFRKWERWWKYTKHLWKENPWNEDGELIRIIQLQLSIMAEEFQTTDITMSAQHDAKRMKLVSKLLGMYMNQYYENKHSKEAHDPVKQEECWQLNDFQEMLNYDTYKEGYDFSHVVKGMEKDQKALELGCKLLARELPGWWQ